MIEITCVTSKSVTNFTENKYADTGRNRLMFNHTDLG